MTTTVVILITSLGVAGLYFLVSSGLSLIFGLMDVLNLAHGAFFGVGGYVAWTTMEYFPVPSLVLRFAIAVAAAALVGFLGGVLIERIMIARNYGDHLAQILVTLGLAFALQGLFAGLFTHFPRQLKQPEWFRDVVSIAGAEIPNSILLIIGSALIVLIALLWFLNATPFGLVIRAGVENRQMVRALGIRVERTFTIVFGIGALVAAIGGALGSVFYNGITPSLGQSQLIFAFIVVIIGGLGSVAGTAVAAVLVAFIQQLVNFYLSTGLGDIAVVALLAAVLLIRPQGLFGRTA
jgi:branched-chain amino acid transport system permease protein